MLCVSFGQQPQPRARASGCQGKDPRRGGARNCLPGSASAAVVKVWPRVCIAVSVGRAVDSSCLPQQAQLWAGDQRREELQMSDATISRRTALMGSTAIGLGTVTGIRIPASEARAPIAKDQTPY